MGWPILWTISLFLSHPCGFQMDPWKQWPWWHRYRLSKGLINWISSHQGWPVYNRCWVPDLSPTYLPPNKAPFSKDSSQWLGGRLITQGCFFFESVSSVYYIFSHSQDSWGTNAVNVVSSINCHPQRLRRKTLPLFPVLLSSADLKD